MEIVLLPDAEADLKYWVETGNKAMIKKIANLIAAIKANPFDGIGKPEPLKYNLKGCWSRRLSREHRIIYEILNDEILVYSIRGHYE